MTPRFDPSEIPDAPDLSFELSLFHAGVKIIAGLDEAGRGAWAGPVSAAAVILPCDVSIEQKLAGVRDSKQLSPQKREELAPMIKSCALGWAVGSASREEIDRIGILHATRLAMQRALESLSLVPAHLLLDALFLPGNAIPQTALIKGDQRSLSIASASILAKTSRDEWMRKLEDLYPGYGFACNKGYGTRQHQEGLHSLGTCPEHRVSYEPVKLVLEERSRIIEEDLPV